MAQITNCDVNWIIDSDGLIQENSINYAALLSSV